jgi:hypothetical protein
MRCATSRRCSPSTPPASRSPARSPPGSAEASRRRSPSSTSAPPASMASCPLTHGSHPLRTLLGLVFSVENSTSCYPILQPSQFL